MEPIYLDYAATTPVDKKVFESMVPFLEQEGNFGNPSSLHSFGQRAMAAIDSARIALAETIAANHREIIFTSGATEANNLIIRGVLKSFFKNKKNCKIIPKIIVSAIEHPSIVETVNVLEKEGAIELVYLPVNGSGIVDLTVLEKNLDDRTILVSVMWINNETGVIQPISKIVGIVNNFRNRAESRKSKVESCQRMYPLVHTDAVQAFNCFDLNVIKSEVDFMTLSSHKIYGPKGAGAIYINQKSKIKNKNDSFDFIESMTTGGDQEYGLRSGTENVPAIVGFANAAKIAHGTYKKEFERLGEISKYFFEKIKNKIPDTKPNVSYGYSPNILNLYFSKRENIGVALDLAGVAASSGSACSQRYEKPSRVLSAMGFDGSRIKQSIRFSFGRFTTRDNIDEAVARIIIALNK